MSASIRDFEHGDAGKIATTKPIAGLDRDSFYYLGMEGLSWTMLEDGEPIAAWGLYPESEGVATVWSEFSERALTVYPVLLAKSVKRGLAEVVESMSLHQVHAMIPADDDVIAHWIEWLGFRIGHRVAVMEGVDALVCTKVIH